LRISREQAVKKGCGEAAEKFAETAKNPLKQNSRHYRRHSVFYDMNA